MTASVNLAAKPFKNEQLPSLLLSLAALALLLLTFAHMGALSQVLPARTSSLHREASDLDARIGQLRREVGAASPVEGIDKATAVRWRAIKAIVDRRALHWTTLLFDLEQALPPNVRLMSITPTVDEGQLKVELKGEARTLEDVYRLGRNLENHAAFHEPTPTTFGSEGGLETFAYQVFYVPPKSVAAGTPPEPTAATAQVSQ